MTRRWMTVVMVLLALALLGAAHEGRSWWVDSAVLAAGLAGLWLTAG